MRRGLRLFALVVACLFASLCVPSTNVLSAPQFEGVTLNVLVSASHTQYEGVWKYLAEFRDKTGIKVELTRLPVDDIYGAVTRDVQLGGANRFDIVEMLDDGVVGASRLMTPAEDFLKADGTDVGQWSQQFPKWLVDVSRYGGKVVYYPHFTTALGVAYRQNLFDNPKERDAFKKKYGYDLPRPPKTPQQMLDAAIFFTRGSGATKLWGLVTPGSGDPALNFFEALTWKSGIDGPFDAQGRFNWGRNHPENVPLVTRSANYIWSLVNKYHVTPPAAASMGAREALDFYTNGQAAMVLTLIHFRWKEMNSPDVISRIGKSVSFEVPGSKAGEGGAAFFWAWGVLKTSKQQKAAWEFVKWVNEDQQLKRALTEGKGVFIPGKISMAQWASAQGLVPVGVSDMIKHAKTFNRPPGFPAYSSMGAENISGLFAGKVTPKQFVEKTGKLGDQIATKFNR